MNEIIGKFGGADQLRTGASKRCSKPINADKTGLKARHVTGQIGTCQCYRGPKARNVTARPEGPGYDITKNPQGLKGRSNNLAVHVPPLQGERQFVCTYSRAFSPGYNRAGFQPYPSDMLKLPPISQRGNVNEIISKFGGADQLRTAGNQLQSLLYAAPSSYQNQ
ncbi:MAG: hypothetical protein ACTHLW_03190 [Verrucomicrobiota bacterium]